MGCSRGFRAGSPKASAATLSPAPRGWAPTTRWRTRPVRSASSRSGRRTGTCRGRSFSRSLRPTRAPSGCSQQCGRRPTRQAHASSSSPASQSPRPWRCAPSSSLATRRLPTSLSTGCASRRRFATMRAGTFAPWRCSVWRDWRRRPRPHSTGCWDGSGYRRRRMVGEARSHAGRKASARRPTPSTSPPTERALGACMAGRTTSHWWTGLRGVWRTSRVMPSTAPSTTSTTLRCGTGRGALSG
mmetsp:Transcript_180/g.573  ORF Transcript_180/g.573 Transcript_180/m.573 type:complete len:243 (+) Transcript_180:507-1235(+)